MGEPTGRHIVKRVARYGDLIVAAILGIAAIGCFVLQALSFSEKTTAREMALFNTLQFVLTVGFAWFSTRAISRLHFEENLRRFAVSAYRRISDIDRMIHRLRVHLKNSMGAVPAEDAHELRVIAAVVDDTLQVVKSSASDWADVIGDELIAIENIKRLEQERAGLADRREQEPDQDTTKEVLRRLDIEIAELIARLPVSLRLDAQPDVDARAAFHVGDWLARQHRKESGLELQVVAGGDYICEKDLTTLQPGEMLRLYRGGERGLVVQDASGITCGRALNATPLSYDEFVLAMGACYGSAEVPVEFLGIQQSRTRRGIQLTWYGVRVKTEPRSRRERLNLLRDGPKAETAPSN